MDKFLAKWKSSPKPTITPPNVVNEEAQPSSKRSFDENNNVSDEAQPSSRRRIESGELDLSSLVADPGLRRSILTYHPNERDAIRRAYLLKGPCQPTKHNFPRKKMGDRLRDFKPEWYDDFRGWLEYSIDKDAAFCLYCYLFRTDKGAQGSGGTFVQKGFVNWARKDKLEDHVGGVNSSHNKAYRMAQDLLNQRQHVQTLMSRQSDKARSEYRIHLNATIDCVRLLLRQGLAFRGHDEAETSMNRENFKELMKYTADHNKDIQNAIQNAPENLELTAPDIQKDIVNAFAIETKNAILEELGDGLFAILIDEARDVSIKEQMALVLRYVDKKGGVVERFFGIVHVKDTNAKSLKKAIEEVFSKHGLSISRLRGQGYDGASNMRGQFNGLQALIMKENASAYYVHCFAHQLQLALVGVARGIDPVNVLFTIVSSVVNVVGSSCKRRDNLREKNATRVVEALQKGEICSGHGLNQETSLKRPGDTRWGSHYDILLSLIHLFPSVLDVLEDIVDDGLNSEQRGEASRLLDELQSFHNIFTIHMMRSILALGNDLSKALQRKDQNIVNAMDLVRVCKTRLETLRDSSWEPLLEEVSSVCAKYRVSVPNMEDQYVAKGRVRRKAQDNTNMYHFRDALFYRCIAVQRDELNLRFNEANTELLLCMACLNPSNAFAAFDKQKLIRFAEFYPSDFSPRDLMVLHDQLDCYIYDVRSNNKFFDLHGVDDLAKLMIATEKDIVYPLVYLLIRLALILPVATASVERAFSAMNIVKNRLRNRMGDEWASDCLVAYIEKDIFESIKNEVILHCFQSMRSRRGQL